MSEDEGHSDDSDPEGEEDEQEELLVRLLKGEIA